MSVSIKNKDYQSAREWYQIIQDRGMVPTGEILMSMMQLEMIDCKVESKDKMLENGSFYFQVAKKLRLVNQNLCKQYALLHLISGSTLKKAMDAYASEISKTGNLKVSIKAVLCFADYILRRKSFSNDYLFHQHHTLRPDFSKEETQEKLSGKKEFLDLVAQIPSLSAERKNYLDLAATYLV
jgi:hypothetical protein